MTKNSQPSTNTGPLANHEPAPALRPFKPFSSLVKIDLSALSHTGLLRYNNEDQFCVTRMSRMQRDAAPSSLPPGDVPERAEEVNYVMIVADGMGGHAPRRARQPAGDRRTRRPCAGTLRTGSSSLIPRRRPRNWSAARVRSSRRSARSSSRARSRGRVPARHGVDVDRCPQPGSGFARLSRRRFPCVSLS